MRWGEMEQETSEVKARVMSGNQVQVLIAEDDMPLANFLKRGLESDKYAVDLVHDGQAALEALSKTQYGLLILDLNLPVMDGMMLLEQLRPTMPALPVLVLTGRSELQDRVKALDGGADDCLVKPFSFHELTARARALLRRHGKGSRSVVRVGDLVLDRSEFRVERAGRKIDLTAKEFALLEYLMLNTRTAVNRAMIMENVWKAPYDAKTNLVDVYVKYVRDKIDAAHCSKLIRTVRGVGYVLAEN
jgi:two-component system, OmpR family, copper resistance phosphate regulon response regulator CusR